MKVYSSRSFLKIISLLAFSQSLLFSGFIFASEDPDTLINKTINWQNADVASDNKMGVSTEKAYKVILKGKKSKKIIVAIIDSGVDTDHEDLKSNIWTNEKEIPGNGIDDDKNGYVDDIHGWNFLGNSKGENVVEESLEVTRVYAKMHVKFNNRKPSQIKPEEKQDYELYQNAKIAYEGEYNDTKSTLERLNGFYKKYSDSDALVKMHLKKETYSLDDLKSITVSDSTLSAAVNLLSRLIQNDFKLETFNKQKAHFENTLKYYLNLEFNPRSIIGDNTDNLKDSIYGNNNVMGGGAEHGTHVAGIVGAIRNNGKGIDGIADNVQLMAVRVVPDGDERDKDIINAIHYAVNNGAKIINMSFGKTISPQKEGVFQALKYAEQRGVLLVHAAGNSSENIDKVIHYPTGDLGKDQKPVSTYLCVGASAMDKDNKLRGNFSNFGKKTVDLFAPGVNIHSSIPNNKYESFNGTSMACPVVAGVAALVWSYYPELSCLQLRDILVKSSVSYKRFKVLKPNTDPSKVKTIKFGKLSKTGAIVNAYEAVKLAEELTKGKK